MKLACLLLLLVIVVVRPAGAQTMNEDLKKEFRIERAQNPFHDFTKSAEDEESALTVRAVSLPAGAEPIAPLGAYTLDGEPWLAVDRPAGRVVVNARLFRTLTRRDATRSEPGKRQSLGMVRDRRLLDRPGRIISFLLESQVVITYWHIGAVVKPLTVSDTPSEAAVLFHATHVYFTNERNEDEYWFILRLDRTSGEMNVEGADRPR